MGRRLHIFQDDVPEIGIIDFELIICTVTNKSALRERARTINQWIFGDSGVVLDDFVNILLEKCFILVMLAILQEAKNTLFEESLHLSFWQFILTRALSSLFKVATNEDSFVQSKFLCRSFKHFSLISIASDKSIDLNFTFLADSMSSGSSLNIVLRIPIRIIDDDNIGTC